MYSTPWIENISMDHVKRGIHLEYNYEKDYLIQIVDPNAGFPVPCKNFKNVLQLKFLDTEDENQEGSPGLGHARQIAEVLQRAKAEGRNVLVHCYAGLCRSGAVAEAGIKMGFREVHTRRWPNRLLGQLLCQELSLSPMTVKEYEDVFQDILDY